MPVAPKAALVWLSERHTNPVSERARPSNTFGWDKKLRKTDEFSSVFRLKRGQRGQGLDCLTGPNGLDIARLGLIVPKKVLARAVDRNRLKRLVREVFRLHQQGLSGKDVIVRVKARRAMAEYREECEAQMRASGGCLNLSVVEKNG